MREFIGVSQELIDYVSSAMEALPCVASPSHALRKFRPVGAHHCDPDDDVPVDSPYADYFAEFGEVAGSQFDILSLVENVLNLYSLSLPPDLSHWPRGGGILVCRVMELLNVLGIWVGNAVDDKLYLHDGIIYFAKSRAGRYLAMYGTHRFIKASVQRNFSEATRMFLENPDNYPYFLDEDGLMRDSEGAVFAVPLELTEGGPIQSGP